MSQKRFTNVKKDIFQYGEWYCSAGGEHCAEVIATALNMVTEENEQLKKEKEFWKSDACSLSNLNRILSNELSIAQEQGYEPSKPYKEYIASIKSEYDKFWENKIKTHNNQQLKGDRE